MDLAWPNVAYMPQRYERVRAKKSDRRWTLHARNEAEPPQSSRRRKGLNRRNLWRMRNTDRAARGSWSTYVRSIRHAMGLGPSAFARQVGVDRTTLHRWESGRYRPSSAQDVARFAEATGVDLYEALRVAGFLPVEPAEKPAPPPPPPLDPDLALLARRLADPATPRAEREIIRAALRHLARLSEGEGEQRRAG